MKKCILTVFLFQLLFLGFAGNGTTPTKKYDSEWKTIIDSGFLHLVTDALELVKETNSSLGSLLSFAGQMQGTSYTDSTGNLPAKSFNAIMADSITKLINGKRLPLEPAELLSYKRVKSIQCNTFGWGFNEYSYMPCKVRYKNGKLFYEKTAGSQRKSGYLYRRDDYSYVFLGGWSVNEDPQTTYESSHRIEGILYKVAPGTIYLFFVGDHEYEIHCLKK